ncbi:uncharacterized protein PITG_05879 [Phytophthora infestans T30-4]|uniref:Uncharacterized protein n=1 Tax=Phytophthora infestans (strain T30-4) TaxID=403677 RepID=D0N5W6_PHYIT|nr:uncharacterized protein PITG_05879 [Phytophthora infestans T30-4]EEY70457.1 hypothetical protein PITG_05879 [Phytophthora infestans T30-4]|eukprot:XP_002998111.1 hypothetical protein PITG_05879 [Phytophthora infestans T30-4]
MRLGNDTRMLVFAVRRTAEVSMFKDHFRYCTWC